MLCPPLVGTSCTAEQTLKLGLVNELQARSGQKAAHVQHLLPLRECIVEDDVAIGRRGLDCEGHRGLCTGNRRCCWLLRGMLRRVPAGYCVSICRHPRLVARGGCAALGGEPHGAGDERPRPSEGLGERAPTVTRLGQQDLPQRRP